MSSTYRGYSQHLRSRAERARGDNKFLATETIRDWLDGYGGTVICHSENRWAQVESFRLPSDGVRRYRVYSLTFTPHPEGGETVRGELHLPLSTEENPNPVGWDTGDKALRAYKRGDFTTI